MILYFILYGILTLRFSVTLVQKVSFDLLYCRTNTAGTFSVLSGIGVLLDEFLGQNLTIGNVFNTRMAFMVIVLSQKVPLCLKV